MKKDLHAVSRPESEGNDADPSAGLRGFPRSLGLRLCLALALIGGAGALQFIILPPLGKRVPYLVIYPAVLAASLLWGKLPGLAAAVAGHLEADFFFMEPLYRLQGTLIAWVCLFIMVVSALVLGHVGERLRLSIARTQTGKARARAMKEALWDSEGQYKALLEAAGDGVVLHPFGLDREKCRIVQCNANACRMLGYSRMELLGLSMLDLQDAEDLDRLQAEADRLEADRMILYEKTLAGKGGRRIPAEINSALFELNGRTMVLSVIRDISERKRAEAALKDSESRLRALVDNLPFDFWALSPEGKYVVQNDYCKAMWGDIRGKTPEEVAPSPETLATWRANNARAFAGEVATGDVTFEWEGRRRTYQNIVAPIRVGDEIHGILGVTVDVTEYREAQEQMRRLDKYPRRQILRPSSDPGRLARGTAPGEEGGDSTTGKAPERPA